MLMAAVSLVKHFQGLINKKEVMNYSKMLFQIFSSCLQVWYWETRILFNPPL